MATVRPNVMSSGLLAGRKDIQNMVLKSHWSQNSWLTDFKNFAGTTTAHGVNYIFVGRNKLIR